MEDARLAPEPWWEPFLAPDDETGEPPAPDDDPAEDGAEERRDTLDAGAPRMRE